MTSTASTRPGFTPDGHLLATVGTAPHPTSPRRTGSDRLGRRPTAGASRPPRPMSDGGRDAGGGPRGRPHARGGRIGPVSLWDIRGPAAPAPSASPSRSTRGLRSAQRGVAGLVAVGDSTLAVAGQTAGWPSTRSPSPASPPSSVRSRAMTRSRVGFRRRHHRPEHPRARSRGPAGHSVGHRPTATAARDRHRHPRQQRPGGIRSRREHPRHGRRLRPALGCQHQGPAPADRPPRHRRCAPGTGLHPRRRRRSSRPTMISITSGRRSSPASRSSGAWPRLPTGAAGTMALAVAPDGRTVATAGRELSLASETWRPRAHASPVRPCVEGHPIAFVDARTLAATSPDPTCLPSSSGT